jgi:hypothetical protein
MNPEHGALPGDACSSRHPDAVGRSQNVVDR